LNDLIDKKIPLLDTRLFFSDKRPQETASGLPLTFWHSFDVECQSFLILEKI